MQHSMLQLDFVERFRRSPDSTLRQMPFCVRIANQVRANRWLCAVVLLSTSACGVANRNFDVPDVAGSGGPPDAASDRNAGGSAGSSGANTGGAGTTGAGGSIEPDGSSDGTQGGAGGTSSDGGSGCAALNACG